MSKDLDTGDVGFLGQMNPINVDKPITKNN